MSEEKERALPVLLAGVAGAVAFGMVLTLAVDGLFTLLGAGEFGQISGFVAILPALLFMHNVQKQVQKPQLLMSLVAAAAAAVPAMAVMFEVAGGWSRLLSGGLGALTFALVYAVVWYAGMRWLAQRSA